MLRDIGRRRHVVLKDTPSFDVARDVASLFDPVGNPENM